jgi:hypothetical protein
MRVFQRLKILFLLAILLLFGATSVLAGQYAAGTCEPSYALNPNGTIEPLTIEDCSVHDFDSAGIAVERGFTATVKANHINSSSMDGGAGIIMNSVGSVTANDSASTSTGSSKHAAHTPRRVPGT